METKGQIKLAKKAAVVQHMLTLACLFPILTAIFWTLHPSIQTTMAVLLWQHQRPHVLEKFNDLPPLEIKRKTQKFLLTYNTYVELDDITVVTNLNEASAKVQHLKRGCNAARLYVFVPFQLNVPFLGKKVFEWCWKPKVMMHAQ